MNDFEAQLLSKPVANLSSVLDVQAAIDYFIITEITKNPGKHATTAAACRAWLRQLDCCQLSMVQVSSCTCALLCHFQAFQSKPCVFL
jgi:hypothetical protein